MKVRKEHSLYESRNELVVLLETGERLNESKAKWLESHAGELLLPLEELERDRKQVTLRYDLHGLRTLHVTLMLPQSSKRLALMFSELMQAIAYCVREGNDYRSMLFDSRSVFVCRDGSLRFVYVPTDSVRFKPQNSPFAFLQYVARTQLFGLHLSWRLKLSRQLRDYMEQSERVFSYRDFRTFLMREIPELWPDIEIAARPGMNPSGKAGTWALLPDVLPQRNDPTIFCRTRVVSPSSVKSGGRTPGTIFLRRLADSGETSLAGEGVWTVGRARDCDVCLAENDTVSRRHAEISVSDGSMRVRDLESTNGTFVNDDRLPPRTWRDVEPGQCVSFATARFEVEKV